MVKRQLWGVMARFGESSYGPISITFTGSFDYLGYAGEPTRLRLFTRRKHAREFCAEQNRLAIEKGSKIRYSPVRVVETVRVVK
jgi:hypothetical protein